MNTGKIMLYLCLCAVNDKVPSESVLEEVDYKELYEISHKHKVTALVCYGLERIMSPPEIFSEAKTKAIRKNMLLSAQLNTISCFLEKTGIYYMPLKGALLKDLYPLGMRQMSDVDILYDRAFRENIRDFMLENGFECVAQTDSQDAYKKNPVYNFEFHHLLFSRADSEVFYDYYKDIKERLDICENSGFRLRMSDEDFYIYIISHEYKHFSTYGTGVRSLLDIIVLLKAFGDSLNWEYIGKELDKLRLVSFEEKQRLLCKKLICEDCGDDLTEEEQELLSYFLSVGVYGDYSTGIVNRITGETGEKDRPLSAGKKIKYIFRRIFPPLEYYRICYPFFYKYKLLLPFCVIYRIFRGIFRRNDFVKSELKALRK